MAVDRSLEDFFTAMSNSRAPAKKDNDVPLSGGGGGGTSGGMEPRIARLEADMEHVKETLSDLKGDVRSLRDQANEVATRVARIEVKVDQLPTVGKLWAAVGASVAAITAVVALVVRFIPHAG